MGFFHLGTGVTKPSSIICPKCHSGNLAMEGQVGGECYFCGAKFEIRDKKIVITDEGNGYGKVIEKISVRKLEAK